MARAGRIGWSAAALAASLLCTAHAVAQTVEETSGRTSWWLPRDVSTTGHEVDLVFYWILYMTGIVGILVFGALLGFLFVYRHKPGRRAVYIHGNNRLELVWTLVPALLMAATAAFSQSTWTKLKFPPQLPSVDQIKAGDAVHVGVIAKQFQWYFQYPGKDGILSKRNTAIMDTSSSDPEKIVGLDRNDPAGKDDFISPKLVVPVNKKVFIELTSVDVIHSFFLPNFRVKQDAMPGLDGKVWLEATQTSAQVIGTSPDENEMFGYAKPFDLVCAELCGQGHYKMRGQMYVVSSAEYQKFLESEMALLAPAGESTESGY